VLAVSGTTACTGQDGPSAGAPAGQVVPSATAGGTSASPTGSPTAKPVPSTSAKPGAPANDPSGPPTVAPSKGAPKTTAGPTKPAPPTATENNEPPPGPQIAVTLCALTRAQVRAALGPSTGSQDQRLRNGIASIEENLETWRYAAQTSPQLDPLVQQADRLISWWRAAVRAYDAGNARAAAAAVAHADKIIAALPESPPAGATDCPV
jgi:hypothetical protein